MELKRDGVFALSCTFPGSGAQKSGALEALQTSHRKALQEPVQSQTPPWLPPQLTGFLVRWWGAAPRRIIFKLDPVADSRSQVRCGLHWAPGRGGRFRDEAHLLRGVILLRVGKVLAASIHGRILPGGALRRVWGRWWSWEVLFCGPYRGYQTRPSCKEGC